MAYFLYPLKVDLSSTNLKMVSGDAQVHLCIANHGKTPLGPYLMAIVAHADILKRELLLVHGRRSKQGCFNALLKPRRSDVRDIADLLNGLDLMATTLCLTIADGNVTSNLLVFAEHIRSWHLRIAESYPASVQAKRLGK